MRRERAWFSSASLVAILGVALIWGLPGAGLAYSQSAGTIDTGTTIQVRTNEHITTNDSDGRVFTGSVEQDVLNRQRRIAIPRGSDVEMIVRRTADDQYAVDLDSITVNGRRYGVETEANVVESQRKDGVGANQRTGKYVGGGAVLGAIIGAIAGGGKGAAIGAGAGAAAGAGAQVLTRGRTVDVPAESLLTFRLAEPLRAGVADRGYMNNGVHYHSNGNQSLYDSGGRQKPSHYSDGRGTVSIGTDRRVTWNGPQNGRVYVVVDNEAPKLFAAGASGNQAAPWITDGHMYTFILQDANGNEIARDQQDTRSRRYRGR
jgi:hypothetical protein